MAGPAPRFTKSLHSSHRALLGSEELFDIVNSNLITAKEGIVKGMERKCYKSV